MTRSPGRSTPRSRRVAAHRTAASSSTSPRAATPEFIRRRLPSMYHQFKELADVDITAEPMEIGPTCHYVMGGIEVDADTELSGVTGPLRGRGVLRAACTAPTGSAATPSPTCWSSVGGPVSPLRRTPGSWGRTAPSPTPRTCCAPRTSRSRRSSTPAARRTPTRSSRTSSRRCRTWSASSAPQPELALSLERHRGAQAARQAPGGRGAPAVQPGLAPRDGPAQHAAGLRGHRQGGARAPGVARWAHP